MATASDTGNPPRPLAPRLRVGDGIPVFSLPNTSGVSVSSTVLLEHGPLIITFYRGIWCPYCRSDLMALMNASSEVQSRGGSLAATFETSLYNEWGERRKDFGLSDVLGASAKGSVEGPLHNSYLQVERQHPLVAGFEKTTLCPARSTACESRKCRTRFSRGCRPSPPFRRKWCTASPHLPTA